ncbi:uncharacterized protein HMPREF1541_04623 [Cyphellophora europaea CBS 101466]|uniref:Uncharacterized protein n=1 Tax=Cyphellophora europaea (strain CBS 101466) TaxID=1220924 RepID=W2RV02_CYPE1|nr:uncharacterized protein HMPREF1541_04623 [Cyphellophora europaea CBS 101466]ETN40346.1 hypothetical protein HMPREF1541_04623 [Cyphellophora europaea CBS 101466]
MHGFKLTGENVEATKSVPDFDQSTLLTMPEPPVVKAEPDATKPKAKRAYNKKKTAPTKVEEPDRETETKRPAPNTTSPPRKRAKTARNIPRKLPGKRQSKLLPEFDNIAGQYGQYLEDLSTRAVSAMLGKEQDKTPGSEVAEEAEASSQASTTGIVAPTTFAHVVHIHDDGGDED